MNIFEKATPPADMFSIFKITVLLLTGSMLLPGCGLMHTSEMERKLMYRSLPVNPAWITRLPADPDYFFALGISANAPSLQQGRLTAAYDAAVEVSKYLGLKASARFEVETTELTTRIINEMTVTTSARLERFSLSQMYYEEFHHAGAEEAANVFDVYVLLRIPIAELELEQQRQKLKRDGILAEVKATNLEAQNHFRAGNFPLAWQKWILAMRLLDEEVGDSVSSLQIYKILLTAVEGINLSIVGEGAPEKNWQINKIPSIVTAQVAFTGDNGDIPLKRLPLHFRLAKDKEAGEIRKTDLSGRVIYSFPSSAKKGLEVRLASLRTRLTEWGFLLSYRKKSISLSPCWK